VLEPLGLRRGQRTFLRPELRGGDFLLVAAFGVGGRLLVLFLLGVSCGASVGFGDVGLRVPAEAST